MLLSVSKITPENTHITQLYQLIFFYIQCTKFLYHCIYIYIYYIYILRNKNDKCLTCVNEEGTLFSMITYMLSPHRFEHFVYCGYINLS